jgi:GGDEF domain-containing protein
LTGLWSTWRDITGTQGCAVAKLEYQARHDLLTGLPNRKVVAEQLSAHIAESAANGERARIAVDGPRPLQGDQRHAWHLAGDQLLKLIGPRLKPLLEATHGRSRAWVATSSP